MSDPQPTVRKASAAARGSDRTVADLGPDFERIPPAELLDQIDATLTGYETWRATAAALTGPEA